MIVTSLIENTRDCHKLEFHVVDALGFHFSLMLSSTCEDFVEAPVAVVESMVVKKPFLQAKKLLWGTGDTRYIFCISMQV